jgi:Fe-S-cluster containining protein
MTPERPPDGDPFAPPAEPGHSLDEEGSHDPDECELCVEREYTVACDCRCGKCCEELLIEVSLRDAEREPRIKELGSPIWDTDIELFEHRREVGGYLLNSRENTGACVFFDLQTRLCTIHETRPLVCRLFNCDQEQERFRDEPPDNPSAARDEERE